MIFKTFRQLIDDCTCPADVYQLYLTEQASMTEYKRDLLEEVMGMFE